MLFLHVHIVDYTHFKIKMHNPTYSNATHTDYLSIWMFLQTHIYPNTWNNSGLVYYSGIKSVLRIPFFLFALLVIYTSVVGFFLGDLHKYLLLSLNMVHWLKRFAY